MEYHFIGDVHGQADRLEALLRQLGYARAGSGWRHPAGRVVFLGDFIDGGPQQRRVIEIVRSMVESGNALAVMGNHEFNALCYHNLHPETGQPLRAREGRHLRQHRAFLEEFALGRPETREVIRWLQSLPLHLEVADGQGRPLFRAIHACWVPAVVRQVPRYLDRELLVQAATRGTRLFQDVELLLKGPEIPLPKGCSFHDKEGKPRRRVRIKWWESGPGATYRRIALVPRGEEENLPETPVGTVGNWHCHGQGEPPVFFGHYWLAGPPRVIGSNLACLDYSAGEKGALVAYRFRVEEAGTALRNDCLVSAA